MAKKVADATIRERRVRVRLEWRDIEALLAKAAIDAADMQGAPGVDGLVVTLSIEQETEGSPSYSVQRWRAMADIVAPLA